MMAPDFTGYASKVYIQLRSELSPDDLERRVAEFMNKIAQDCVRDGAWLLGHVKCIVEDPHEEFLACSVTHQRTGARCHGNMTAPTDRFTIVMNVLLYGLADRIVERIVVENLNASFGEAAELTVENLLEEHDGRGHVHRNCGWIKFEEEKQ